MSVVFVNNIAYADPGSVVTAELIPGVGATDLGKAEDAASTSGDTGVFMLGVRNDSAASLTSTDGDYGGIAIDVHGFVKGIEQYQPVAEDNSNGLLAILMKPVASSTYSSSAFKNAGANTTLNVKNAPGNVYSIRVTNSNAAARYFQLHNTVTTPAGGATAQFYALIPGGSVAQPAALELDTTFFAPSEYFSTGIAFAISTAEATYTAATAGDHETVIRYV